MKYWQLLLLPLSFLIGVFAKLRRICYQTKLLKSVKLPIPVISVGNLTVGGTGKTPVTEFLLEQLLEMGKRPAIICRAYKARQVEPAEILELKSDSAFQFGDEAVQIKTRFPHLRVFVGQSKSEIAAMFLLQRTDVDVVIVDDGFQHLKLHRDLNVVLLDANEVNYLVVPSGRGREFDSALKDSDIVVVTKLNKLMTKSTQNKLDLCHELQIPVVISEMKGTEIPESFASRKWIVFSGLANNEAFFTKVGSQRQNSKRGAETGAEKAWEQVEQKIETVGFQDHHQYSKVDIQRLCRLGNKESSVWICTEKDWVKVQSLWPKDFPLQVVRTQVQIISGKEKLDAALNKLFS